LITGGISLATPLVFASLGEVFSEKAGVLNIGIEGYMLMGAMTAFVATYYTGSLWTGVLVAALASSAFSLIHGYVSITLGSDQLVSGIGINILAFGLTSVLYRMGPGSLLLVPKVSTFEPINIPYLTDLPIIGPIFFNYTPLVYLALLFIVVFTFILYRTSFGLRLRAVGEDPLAAETMGVNVHLIRYVCVAIAGGMGGIGGAFLTLSYLSLFAEGMTAGRGFIVLAVVIAAGWDPVKAAAICFIFGFSEALSLRLQILGLGIPYPFLFMIPYALTILILILRRKVFVPKALCVPYTKEEE